MEIKIKHDKRKLQKKGYRIVIYISSSRHDWIMFSTGYFAFENEWDEERSEPTKNHPLYFELYGYILDLKIKISKILYQNLKLSAQSVKELLLGNNPESLVSFWQNYITELERKGNTGNAKFYKSCLSALTNFKSEVLFTDITYDFLVKFRDYHLTKRDANGKKLVSNNGVIIYLRGLRAIYNEALKRKLFKPEDMINPFSGVMPKAEATKDKYFTIQEMKTIYEIENKHKYYDYFMLCFLLGGIDYVDLANLKYSEHVKNGRVKFTRFKGGTSEIIDNKILPEAEEILQKYKDHTDYLVPLHSFEKESYSFRDNYVRRYRHWLKSIGVESYFTSKTPRYTFINIGKELLLNRDVIMELTGHSRGDVHAIYEGAFPYHIKDDVHRQIIDAVIKTTN